MVTGVQSETQRADDHANPTHTNENEFDASRVIKLEQENAILKRAVLSVSSRIGK